MRAAISAMALRVSESAFARLWWQAGDVLDRVIPLALFAAIVAAGGAIAFGFVH